MLGEMHAGRCMLEYMWKMHDLGELPSGGDMS